jgi:hypothetical protein
MTNICDEYNKMINLGIYVSKYNAVIFFILPVTGGHCKINMYGTVLVDNL